MFMDSFKNELNSKYNVSYTENGAAGYATTNKALLDLNFSAASLRSASESEIVNKFMLAYAEDALLAIKWLFFARDTRQGLGERRLFRVVFRELKNTRTDVTKLIHLVAEYGRWDDLWCLLDDESDDSEIALAVYHLVEKQLEEDFRAYSKNKPISLLAKWLPSTNASSKKTKALAKRFVSVLGYTDKTYRQMLSKLRAYSNVVEVKMCANEWGSIDYETVPSKANIIYNSAFLRNDEERRRAYLAALEKGEAKINSSVLYPHDVVHKYYNSGSWYCRVKSYDAALEAMWKNLPQIDGLENTLVVADGSGSMTCRVGNTNINAIEVANALAIYFAEHNTGEFYNKYITFSMRPQFVDLGNGSLRDKLNVAFKHDECSNTNIEAVFDLILSTAVNNKMRQEELPKNVLILSDMEFDRCAYRINDNKYGSCKVDAKLFDTIRNKFEAAGYMMPRLVFWNLDSRTGTIPITENKLGVALVSGFSTNIAKMVMSNKTDPYECLLEILNSERYKAVEEALKN